MDALKKVLPFGSRQDNQQSGQEPVSGQQGEGTATEPYDAGNRQDDPELGGKAPQHTTPVSENLSESGQDPASGQPGEGTATEPFDPGNREDDSEFSEKALQQISSDDVPSSHVMSDQRQVNDSSATDHTDVAPKLVKHPTIGSSRWFMNANPFAKRAESSVESATEQYAPTSDHTPHFHAESQSSETLSALPPNHLGDDVPPGQNAIVHEPVFDPSTRTYQADPGQESFDRSKGKGKGKAAVVEDYEPRDTSGVTEASSAASNRSERFRPDSTFTDYTYPTAGTDASTIASSSRRSSGVMNIPHSKGIPITAGGVPLGFRAMQDRERRFLSMPIYEQPEQDYHWQPKSDAISQSVRSTEPQEKAASSSALHNIKRYESVGEVDHAKKTSTPEEAPRRMSVMQKAKSFGRKVRHSISN